MNEEQKLIETGQWKGWTQFPDGSYSKTFGPKGQNPTVHVKSGYFYPYDKKGFCKGCFGTLFEALEAVGIKK